MDVLISWSKKQSKDVALALYKWLPMVIPGIKLWMSSEDIEKGREWFQELHKILAQAKACIICVTQENVRSPWIYYETGAIAVKKNIEAFVCPYLVGVSPGMLADGPLREWQCTNADRDDTWKLIKSLNDNALETKHDLLLLQRKFEEQWPNFAKRIQPIAEIEVDDEEGFITTEADQLAGVNLSAESRKMILEVSKDQEGSLIYESTKSETSFEANGVNLCPDKSPRTIARWEDAKKNLVSYDILMPIGDKGELFKLTAKGYDIADALRGEKEQ